MAGFIVPVFYPVPASTTTAVVMMIMYFPIAIVAITIAFQIIRHLCRVSVWLYSLFFGWNRKKTIDWLDKNGFDSVNDDDFSFIGFDVGDLRLVFGVCMDRRAFNGYPNERSWSLTISRVQDAKNDEDFKTFGPVHTSRYHRLACGYLLQRAVMQGVMSPDEMDAVMANFKR